MSDRILPSPTVFNGTVYAGSSDENLYELDAADGTQERTLGASERIVTTPAARGDLVFAGSGAGNVYALNASTGNRE
jgi:outer membrane protein assembly factor BamB